ncbi:hypothetical protein IHV25_10080 [Phaeovibrio sulfidiphilus]|uniref:DUF4136 domain-containing protein n=1 Tax=Phaeovibrio sulfidiphilus TaxID=1220600 RepID=A0A8J6YRA6_9PROT|nr:hypothetical protein [Phaeovibrio sulfidiphilus]MBE1237987.1 hypothetical protein [Phaeovibrio sulfidiphilus]
MTRLLARLPAAALGAALMMAGCSTALGPQGPWGVSVDVATYHRSGTPPALAGQKTAVIAQGEQAASLEFNRVRERLDEELTRAGAVVVGKPAAAAIGVTLSASVSAPMVHVHTDEYRRTVLYNEMLYPTLWPGTNYSFGFSPLGYRHQGWREPSAYGAYPYRYQRHTYTETLHDITVRLRVYDMKRLGRRSPANELPDAEVVASLRSASPSLEEALPVLIRAALSAYPGVDGQHRSIEVPPLPAPDRTLEPRPASEQFAPPTQGQPGQPARSAAGPGAPRPTR